MYPQNICSKTVKSFLVYCKKKALRYWQYTGFEHDMVVNMIENCCISQNKIHILNHGKHISHLSPFLIRDGQNMQVLLVALVDFKSSFW